MKLKRFTAILALVAMMATMLFGCGNSDDDKTTAADKGTQADSTASGDQSTTEEPSLFNTDGTLPIVNEPVTLKVLTIDSTTHATGHTYTSKLWDWLTEKTGIQFEVETYSADDMKTKLPLIMSGDDLPDIFMQCNFSYADLESYAAAGKILALDDLIEEYGYYTKQLMEARDDDGVLYAADGRIYGLARFNPTRSSGNGNLGVNQEWLDNLGLKAPENLEELYDVLVAFRDKDANGNGDPNDELPMSIVNGHMNTMIGLYSTVGIASYWPVTGVMFDDNDGEVYMARTSDNYRYLLTWLKKCYEEGLLDTEMFTQSSSELKAKREENRVGVTGTYGVFDYTEKACGKELTYTGLVIGSEVSDPVCGISMPVNPNLFSISATTEYPEICFLLGDYFYSEELSWLSTNGVIGENIEWTDEANFQYQSVTGSVGNEYYLMANNWMREEWYQLPKDPVTAAYKEKIAENGKVAFQNYLVFTQEENDLISLYSTDLTTVLDEYLVHFITGEKDIETEWDDYVKLVESLHVKELTEIYQAAYDRLYAD